MSPTHGAIIRRTSPSKKNIFNANPDQLLLVRSAADILKAKREKKFGVVLGTQDTSMVGPELDRLAQMKKDGVMTVQLTYNNRNLAGDGALEPANAGLSKLGRATIERIEAEKLLLDLSHGGARTMAEAAAHAKRPLVISHTGARALTDHPRNTSDETIKAVADKGGVVGVYFMPFLTLDSKPKGEDLLRHVEHIANVAGEDHVGIGTDNGVLPQCSTPKRKEARRMGARADQGGHRRAGRGRRRLSDGRGLQLRRPLPPLRRRPAEARLERGAAGEADGRQFPARLSRGVGRLSLSDVLDVVAEDLDPVVLALLPHGKVAAEGNRIVERA